LPQLGDTTDTTGTMMIKIQFNKIIKIIKRDGVLYTLERIINKILRRELIHEKIFKNITGLIHVGGNLGQEIALYEQYSLNVIWIEPIPEIFEKLQENINEHPKQKALRYLLTDADDQEIFLNIANNDGASSSILDLALHADIWPEIYYIKSIPCKTITLNTLIKREGININLYQALVLDTQGSELLVLKGGGIY